MATAVANRYARALADVVSQTGEYAKIREELESFAALYRESPDLREALRTPALSGEAKGKLLEAILARLEISSVAANFLRVLSDNYRLPLLEEILLAYQRIALDRLGIARVKISSAVELSPEEKQELRARFEALTRRKVEVEFRVEKDLLGGVLAQIGSTVYDGSVRGHLERIRERLTAR
jgi:F-type H+-transporting ATPase subunit delta